MKATDHSHASPTQEHTGERFSVSPLREDELNTREPHSFGSAETGSPRSGFSATSTVYSSSSEATPTNAKR